MRKCKAAKPQGDFPLRWAKVGAISDRAVLASLADNRAGLTALSCDPILTAVHSLAISF